MGIEVYMNDKGEEWQCFVLVNTVTGYPITTSLRGSEEDAHDFVIWACDGGMPITDNSKEQLALAYDEWKTEVSHPDAWYCPECGTGSNTHSCGCKA